MINENTSPVLVETLNIFKNDTPVRNLMVVRSNNNDAGNKTDTDTDKLVILSDQVPR